MVELPEYIYTYTYMYIHTHTHTHRAHKLLILNVLIEMRSFLKIQYHDNIVMNDKGLGN